MIVTAVHRTRPRPWRLALALLAALVFCAVHAGTAHAMTLLGPNDAADVGATNTTPYVAFDTVQGESPKWVLLAMSSSMANPVRYCRQWTPVTMPNISGVHVGCNAWAIGKDAAGNDTIEHLVPGDTYFWQVVYTDVSGAQQLSAVRSFTVADDPSKVAAAQAAQEAENALIVPDPDTVMAKIDANVFGSADGLNKGAAATVNSGVSSVTLGVSRTGTNRWVLDVAYHGAIVPKESYVRVDGTGGSVDVIKLVTHGANHLKGVWVRTSAELAVKDPTYSLQAWVRSDSNQALVRSTVSKVDLAPKPKPRRSTQRTIII